jgi:hypothetical protein
MDGFGDQLLANAAFARDQYRAIRWRHSFDSASDPFQSDAFADKDSISMQAALTPSSFLTHDSSSKQAAESSWEVLAAAHFLSGGCHEIVVV